MNIWGTIVTLSISLILSGCSRNDAIAQSLEPVASTQQTVIPDPCPKDAKTLISWNTMNYGSKKSNETIALMARILTSRGIEYRDREKIKADIILLQEVNAGPKTGGAQAVARLAGALGQNWDYIISDPTTGAGVERYATLWDKGSFIVDRREAHLVGDLADQVDREPYGVRLQWGSHSFWTYGYHAVPTAKHPIQEVRLVAGSQELATRDDIILAGDFNLGRITIEGIFEGWQDHIDGKTSLKQKLGKNGEHRLYQYDHILTRGQIHVCDSGIIDFVEIHYAPITDENLTIARTMSDHLPTYIRFTYKIH